jgi:hypothetical protein
VPPECFFRINRQGQPGGFLCLSGGDKPPALDPASASFFYFPFISLSFCFFLLFFLLVPFWRLEIRYAARRDPCRTVAVLRRPVGL